MVSGPNLAKVVRHLLKKHRPGDMIAINTKTRHLKRPVAAFFSTNKVCDTVPFFQIDSFSQIPFHGNPAAVVLLPAEMDLTDASMAKIAAENNLVVICV